MTWRRWTETSPSRTRSDRSARALRYMSASLQGPTSLARTRILTSPDTGSKSMVRRKFADYPRATSLLREVVPCVGFSHPSGPRLAKIPIKIAVRATATYKVPMSGLRGYASMTITPVLENGSAHRPWIVGPVMTPNRPRPCAG
jgi:hypothetical protein